MRQATGKPPSSCGDARGPHPRDHGPYTHARIHRWAISTPFSIVDRRLVLRFARPGETVAHYADS